MAKDLEAQRSEKPIQADETVNHKKGRPHTYHTTKFRLFDDEENLVGTCAVSFDITERKRLEQEVLHDFLTGLYNLRYLEENFERDLARANNLGIELVLVFIDLDEFKRVNDQLGHDKGNDVLRAMAKVLKENMYRIDDVAIRLGGDEFGLLMQSESRDLSSSIIEYVHSEINTAIAEVMQGESIQCTASMGVKFLDPSRQEFTYSAVYHEVDKAL